MARARKILAFILAAPPAGINPRNPNRLGHRGQLLIDLGLVLRDGCLLGLYFLYHGEDSLLLSRGWHRLDSRK